MSILTLLTWEKIPGPPPLYHTELRSGLMLYEWISLVPRLSRNTNMYRVESLVSFVRKHDVIKIGPKQKRFARCSTNYASMLGVYDIDTWQLDTCIKLPTTFVPLLVLSLIRPRTIKVASTSCLSFTTSHVWKNTRLYMPAQLQCLCSRAWEPGNEAMSGWLETKTSKVLVACLSTE